MKAMFTFIIPVVFCASLHAQSISVTQFRPAPNDFSAAAQATRRLDPDGNACALVKIATHQTGFSFDAGASCIADIVYAEPGVWLYIPSGTRKVTISHKQFGTVSGWQFPVSLEPARTYEMTLKTELPEKARPPRPVKPEFDVTGFSSHFLMSHVGMEISQGEVYSATFGISYCFLPKKTGFYASVDYSSDSGVSIFGGPVLRMLDSNSSTDWQVYAGVGLTAYGTLGVDAGSRFAWQSDKILSRYDFSIGCQYWGEGTVVPYVGLGAEITGCVAAAVAGVILAVVAAVL